MKSYQLNFEPIKEDFTKSYKTHYGIGYEAGKQSPDKNTDQQESLALKYLNGAREMAQHFSNKTGLSMPLVAALIASGVTGGVAAIPFATLLYFSKKHLNDSAGKAFDATWDAVSSKYGNKQQQSLPLQPENFSFKEWLIYENEKETWSDYLGRKIGHGVGRIAGNISGFSGRISNAIKSSLKNIYEYVSKNPKEVAKAAFLVGIGAATGGVLGKLSVDIQDMVANSVQNVAQIPTTEMAFLKHSLGLNPNLDVAGSLINPQDITKTGIEGTGAVLHRKSNRINAPR